MCTPDNFLTEFLTKTVAETQRHIAERSRWDALSRRYHAKNDKETIATWKSGLERILHVVDVC